VLEDLLYFIDVAVDEMAGILEDLGDELANQVPALSQANSPYAILNHSLGVMAFWGGQVAAGREIHRDRQAEFTARGEIKDLVARAEEAKRQLRADLESAPQDGVAEQRPRYPVGPERPSFLWSTAVVHTLVELAQHRGKMEITRDLLRRDAAP